MFHLEALSIKHWGEAATAPGSLPARWIATLAAALAVDAFIWGILFFWGQLEPRGMALATPLGRGPQGCCSMRWGGTSIRRWSKDPCSDARTLGALGRISIPKKPRIWDQFSLDFGPNPGNWDPVDFEPNPGNEDLVDFEPNPANPGNQDPNDFGPNPGN